MEAMDKVNLLATDLSARNTNSRLLQRYYDGDHPMAYVHRKAKASYNKLIAQAVSNFPLLIIDSVNDRLAIQGFRMGSEEADALVWGEMWQPNNLDIFSSMIHQQSLVTGISYASVWPDEVGRPRIRGESSFEVIHEVDPADPLKVRSAMKMWVDTTQERCFIRLFEQDRITFLSSPSTTWNKSLSSTPDPSTMADFVSSAKWTIDNVIDNPFGEGIPIVPFLNRPRMNGTGFSEIGDLLPVFDRINTLTADLLLAAELAAFKIRWATGLEIPVDTNGKAVEPFDVALDRLWVSENPETKFGSFEASPLDPYAQAIDQAIQQAAAISRTPPFLLLGKLTNLPLALDTVIPTPTGLTTMGDLVVGDEVFVPDGTPTEVVALSPIYLDRDCYEVSFDDGTRITADAEHEWVVSAFDDPEHPYMKVGGVSTARRSIVKVTTEQMAGQVLTSMGTFNQFIPVSTPFDAPDADLPIDPYVLGVWLGDGCSLTGTITAHKDDAPYVAERIRWTGETVLSRPASPSDPTDNRVTLTVSYDKEVCPRGHVRPTGTKFEPARCPECAHLSYEARRDGVEFDSVPNRSFRSRLERVGVWQNKHIPEAYYTASFKQRLALVQGLMDTDGTVNRKQGSVKLAFHDERLATDAHRLIMSLGHKVKLVTKIAHHKKFGPARVWLMTWSALDPVFQLPRKAVLQRVNFGKGDGKSASPLRRYITAVTPVPSVPVRCITVAHEDHLFCATTAFVMTSNSAEALKATESGLVQKVQNRMRVFGEAWEDVINLGLALINDPRAGMENIEVLWKDPENVSEAAKVDALVKLSAIGLPWRAVMERWGATPGEIDRWEALKAQDAFEALMQSAALGSPGFAGPGQAEPPLTNPAMMPNNAP
jgi:Phage portal protein, SPP1 Gp6-like/LAGLIDADG-like domain